MAYDKLTPLNLQNPNELTKVICFDDMVTRHGTRTDCTFVTISNKDGEGVYLGRTENEPMKDYINKLRVLRDELNKFISYLEHDR